MIKFFKKNKNLVVDILIILLLGILSLTWFRGNNLIAGGDFGIPFDWLKYLESMFSVWYSEISLGVPEYRNIASLIPYALLGGTLQFLGFSLIFIEKVFFYFWFAGCGLSMYYLCSVLGMKRLGKMTASIFYMLNPFALIIIWHISHALIQMPYAFAPLYLGLYIYGLKNKKGIKYIISAVFLLLITVTASYAWPAAAIINWLPIIFYFLTVLIFQPKERSFTLKFTLIFLGIWLAFNFYWLFPFIFSISESITSSQSPVILSDIQTLKLTSVKLWEAIRMFGFWSLHGGYKGEPYYPYEGYYKLPFIILISWLTPLLALLGFFHRNVIKKPIIFFFIFVILFGLIGMSWPHLPISNFLFWLYQIFPTLALLTRFNFLFFGIPTYLVFTVLLGYGVLFIKEWSWKKIGKLIYLPLGVLFISLFIVLVWPFWNGEVIRSEGKIWPGERVKIPNYWWEMKEWLAEQKDFFRILPLPISKTYNVAFDWEKGYTGGDPTRWFTSQPVLNNNIGENSKILELIGGLIEKETDFKQVGKLLGFLNVKYLLYREDTRWEFLRGHPWWFKHNPENISRFIEQQKDLTLVKEMGKLKFYQIKPEYLLPHIYIPKSVDLFKGEVVGLADIATFLNPQDKEAIIFSSQNENKITDDLGDEFNRAFVWQQPTFLIAEEKKFIGLEDISESLPFARILPNSRLYVLIQIKEHFKKLFSPLSKKIEVEIIFTGKRLKEVYGLLEKEPIPLIPDKDYIFKEANMTLVLDTINHSISEWQIIGEQVEKLKNKETKEEINKKISNQTSIQLIFLESLQKNLVADQSALIYPKIKELKEILEKKKEKEIEIEIEKLDSMIDRKLNSQKVTYKIEIPQDGQYEVYLRNDDFLKYYSFPNNSVSFAVDEGDTQERLMEFTDNNSIFLGELSFNKGFHRINLFVSQYNDLITDPSFEQGIWSGAESIPLGFKSEILAEQSSDAFQGNFSLKLSTSQNNAVVFVPINNFVYGDIYKVSFAVKHLEGEAPALGVWENDTKSRFPDFNFPKISAWGTSKPQTLFYDIKKFPSDKNWQRYEFILKPQDATQALGLAFFAFQSKSGKTVNLYDDVKVERLFVNPILLKGLSLEKNKKLPTIQFTKINPTRYRVEIKNATDPYFLIFSESYHPGWQASIEGEHLMLNGFANGWYIKKTGDYKIILDFRPQRIYYISILISALAFFAGMIYLLVKRKDEN